MSQRLQNRSAPFCLGFSKTTFMEKEKLGSHMQTVYSVSSGERDWYGRDCALGSDPFVLNASNNYDFYKTPRWWAGLS